MSGQKPRTLFDKIWDAHVVETLPDGTALLYIDLHLTHEGPRRRPMPACARRGAGCAGRT